MVDLPKEDLKSKDIILSYLCGDNNEEAIPCMLTPLGAVKDFVDELDMLVTLSEMIVFSDIIGPCM